MIFDWSGLKDNLHFLLIQKNDPLKYCNYAFPVPSAIGLPFMPCDLPNQYQLVSTDQNYQEIGDIYLTFQEECNLVQRILMPASHRPWSITGFDYYQHTPYEGVREANCCFSSEDRPTVQVKYQQRFIGKIVERTILNCCCNTQTYQQFEIYNNINEMIYKVISKNPQRGHFLILPWCGFDKIRYEIVKVQPHEIGTSIFNQQNEVIEQIKLINNTVVGQIVHLFNGLSEYTSKNDKYGITLPQNSTQQQKCLIIYCTLLIDYLLFCNF